LFGAFGSYGMDGSRTPRSDMASAMAQWANDKAQGPLWEAKPLRGEVGILVVRETHEFDVLFARAEDLVEDHVRLHGADMATVAEIAGACFGNQR
ncbi:hypothetical protein, partial [Rhizobium leguminosarum]|uniref:hypothetical protein n=1 Tax=Rhizobium leguminosarum TaxID=384 RepID=UPI003F9DE585